MQLDGQQDASPSFPPSAPESNTSQTVAPIQMRQSPIQQSPFHQRSTVDNQSSGILSPVNIRNVLNTETELNTSYQTDLGSSFPFDYLLRDTLPDTDAVLLPNWRKMLADKKARADEEEHLKKALTRSAQEITPPAAPRYDCRNSPPVNDYSTDEAVEVIERRITEHLENEFQKLLNSFVWPNSVPADDRLQYMLEVLQSMKSTD